MCTHMYPWLFLQGCFLEQWDNPGVRDADFIFFNNSSGWFNNSKALVRQEVGGGRQRFC